MKRSLVLLVLLVLAACTQAPTPGDEVQPDLAPLIFGGPGDEGVRDLAKHATGVYTVGYTTNTGRPNPYGEADAFIRKYSSSRSVIWTRKFGSTEHEFVQGAASDPSDDVYVAGSTYGNLAGSRGQEDIFLRKYTSSGRAAWTRQFGTTGGDSAAGIATYGGSAVYVVGYTDGKLGGSVGNGELFIRKYSSGGSVAWTRQFASAGEYDEVRDVAVDGGGNAYVVGTTSGSLGTANGGGTDMFVRKYSPSGSTLWTRQLHYSVTDSANAVTVSGSNVYLGVDYVSNEDEFDFQFGVRIIKFSTSGARARGWEFVYNPSGGAGVLDLSTDRDGNIYFSGITLSSVTGDFDGMVVKLNPGGGRVWGKRVVSSGDDWANAVLARTTSEVYVAGSTSGVLGDANRGNFDPYLRRLRGSDGSTVWTEQ